MNIKERASKAFPIIISVGDDEYISKTAPIERKAYIMGAADQEEIDAIKALKAFCRCECDAKLLACPHKAQGGCTKYKKFKGII